MEISKLILDLLKMLKLLQKEDQQKVRGFRGSQFKEKVPDDVQNIDFHVNPSYLYLHGNGFIKHS